MSLENPFGSRGSHWSDALRQLHLQGLVSDLCTAVLLAAPLLGAVEWPSQMRSTLSITFSEKALPPRSAGGRIATPALQVWETCKHLDSL